LGELSGLKAHPRACRFRPDNSINEPWSPTTKQLFSGPISVAAKLLTDLHSAHQSVEQRTKQPWRCGIELVPEHIIAPYLVAKVIEDERNCAVEKV